MIDVLADNALLLLFTVIAVGHLLGGIRVGGFHLGTAAVLFAGLAFGAVDDRLALGEEVYLLGLVLFVYSVGLASGPGFVAALRGRGLRANGVTVVVLLFVAAIAAALAAGLSLQPATAAGTYAGAMTNTPALAAVLELVRNDPAARDLPVVGYSVAYPVGVLAALAAIHLLRAPLAGRAGSAADAGSQPAAPPEAVTVEVDAGAGRRLAGIRSAVEEHVAFGRLRRGTDVLAATDDTVLERGDLVTVVALPATLDRVVGLVGRLAPEHLELDRSHIDFRRMFVSSRDVAGRRLSDLHLESHAATVTRIRRGDVDLVAERDSMLELGDRVRVVAPRERMTELARLFGDSYRELSDIDITTFAVGAVLGLLLGLVAIPLPGGATFRFGLAGGPLLVGLLLSTLGRTGHLLWQLPYSANLTLRQIGTVLFLAGIGTRSGTAFWETVRSPDGLVLAACAAVIAAVAATTLLWLAVRRLGVPFFTAAGMLAGLQTQPAVLTFAVEQAGTEQPNVGYATVYPVAMVIKIVVAQLLVAWL